MTWENRHNPFHFSPSAPLTAYCLAAGCRQGRQSPGRPPSRTFTVFKDGVWTCRGGPGMLCTLDGGVPAAGTLLTGGGRGLFLGGGSWLVCRQ